MKLSAFVKIVEIPGKHKLKTAPPLSGAAMQLLWMNNRPQQAYCIIRSSQVQAEHTFHTGCYFYTQKPYGIPRG